MTLRGPLVCGLGLVGSGQSFDGQRVAEGALASAAGRSCQEMLVLRSLVDIMRRAYRLKPKPVGRNTVAP